MNKPFDPSNQDLIIGEGVSFTGTIAAPGKAIISGAVSGSIAAQDLLVEKSGTITGKVRADTMNVHGSVANDVACSANLMRHHPVERKFMGVGFPDDLYDRLCPGALGGEDVLVTHPGPS